MKNFKLGQRMPDDDDDGDDDDGDAHQPMPLE